MALDINFKNVLLKKFVEDLNNNNINDPYLYAIEKSNTPDEEEFLTNLVELVILDKFRKDYNYNI